MRENEKRLIKLTLWMGLGVLIVQYLIFKPQDVKEWLEYAGYAVSFALIFYFVYERWLWRWNPLERTPRLSNLYDGSMQFDYCGQTMCKPILVRVKQTLLSVHIKAETDINSSSTIVGAIVEEHGEFSLYYSYITSPNVITYQDNPIQYGTCRMRLGKSGEMIRGNYWTSRKSCGDMEWTPKAS